MGFLISTVMNEPTATTPERNSRLVNNLSLFIVLIGIFLRVRQFAVNRSLWLDEALLSNNITVRSFSGLFRPLDGNQAAPIGFLLVQKALIGLFGNKDFILRLLPLLAGIAALLLMRSLTRVINGESGGFGGLLALCFFAFSEQLIYYSSEVKQYSCDVLATVSLTVLALKYLGANATARQWMYFGAAGLVLFWLSHPSLFIFFGICLAFAMDAFAEKNWRKLLLVGGIVSAQAVNFYILFRTLLSTEAANNNLLDYWGSGFMPMPPWRDLGWFYLSFIQMLQDPMGFAFRPLVLVLLLMGCVSFSHKNRGLFLCFVFSFLAVLSASALKKYPVSGRLLLFTAPMVYLLAAEGIEALHTGLIRVRLRKWLAFSMFFLLSGLLLYGPIHHLFQPPILMEEIKPVMSYLSQHKSYEDWTYVYYASLPAFKYYAPSYGLQGSQVIEGIHSRDDPGQYLSQVGGLRDYHPIWFLFSHCFGNEENIYLNYLDGIGRKRDEFHAQGASVYLYDLADKRARGEPK